MQVNCGPRAFFELAKLDFVFRVLVLLFLLLSSRYLLAQEIVVRADPQYFPATYQVDGLWKGMDIEIIEEILARAKLDYIIVSKPFQRSLLEIAKGDIHLIPNLVHSKERSEYMDWLGPMRTTCIGLVVQKKHRKLPIQTTSDVVEQANRLEMNVGYLSGASYSEYLDDKIKNDTRLYDVLHFLPDNNQHRQMLKLGRLLGYFYDAFEVNQRMSSPEYAHLYEGLALHAYRVEESCTGAFVGVSKKLSTESFLAFEVSS